MKCYNCGAELSDDTKFCSYCGVKIEKKTPEPSQSQEPKNYGDTPHETPTNEPLRSNTATKASLGDNIKGKLSGFWNGLDLFCKVATVAIVAVAILLIVSVCAKRGLAIFFSIFQLAGIITALLMHKGTIKLEQKLKWLKYLVLVFAILFTALNVMSYSWGQANRPSGTPAQNPTDYQTPATTDAPAVTTTAAAPCSSEDCIGKSYSSIESDFYSAGFEHIEVEKVEDLERRDADSVDSIVSVSIGGTTEFLQGQEFDKEDEVVIVYHAYKKCSIIMHVNFIPNLIFSKYDVELSMNGISQGTLEHGVDGDFEFSVEPGEYTFMFEKDGSSSVNGSVVLDVKGEINISLKISCYNDKVDVETVYIEDVGALGENDAMISADCADYKDKEFEEYSDALKSAGFTNITLEPVYDAVAGDSSLGKIEKVTIAETSGFERGDVFARDASVIISYHADESEDPVKQAQAAVEATLEAALPKEMARRAVVVAMTNCQATDVFASDGNTYDISKFHSYSDIEDFFMMVNTDGIWSAFDESTWHVDGIILRIFDYDTYLKVSCNIKKDGDSYVIFNVDRTIAAKDYINSDDPSKTNTEHFEPSEYNPFLSVSASLIIKDRDNTAAQAKVTAKEERQTWIENQFHWWDGRHTALSDLIKENLNDSDSFKHVDASYIDVYDETRREVVNQTLKDAGFSERVEVGDLFVIEEFTAKNAFNATIKSTAYGIVRGNNNMVILLGIV